MFHFQHFAFVEYLVDRKRVACRTLDSPSSDRRLPAENASGVLAGTGDTREGATNNQPWSNINCILREHLVGG